MFLNGSIELTAVSFVSSVAIMSVVIYSILEKSNLGGYNWKQNVVERERLKIQADYAGHILGKDNPYGRAYCGALRIQRDVALSEGKIELAKAISTDLEKCIERYPGE